MEIKIIDNKKDFLNLQTEWESLQCIAEDVTYYSTFQFLYEWYTNLANQVNTKLCIVCVFEKNEVIAIAPLMIEDKKYLLFKATVLRFLGRADLLTILIDKNVKRQAVLKKIFEVINKQLQWDKLELTHIAAHTDLAHFCFKSELYNDALANLGENPVLSISDSLEFPAYKKQFFKKNINYYRNKLKKDLNANLEVVGGDTELNNISKIHIDRNSDSKTRRSLFEDDNTFAFIKTLYKSKELTLTFLLKTEAGELISYATCYLFNGTLHNWNTSFNLKFKDYSAGDLIYFEMINYVFENKKDIKRIDFGAGRYAWKFRMTDTFIPTYKLNLNNKESKKIHLLNIYDKIFKIGKIILQ
tara:strand:+ start:6749 stop:7819 length:1071 start_codon:yes stop_codon:yes gene_type:complete